MTVSEEGAKIRRWSRGLEEKEDRRAGE